MVSFEILDSATADLSVELAELANWAPDLTAVRDAVIATVRNVNEADRLRGLDRFGKPLEQLSPVTLKRRKGPSTPFAEHGTASRAINNLIVDVDFSPRSLGVRMQWVGAGWLANHARGDGRLPVRDILGLRAETMGLLDAMVIAESDREFARMAERAKSRGFFGGARNFLASFFGR